MPEGSNMTEYVVVFLISLLGGTIQSVTGFGAGVVIMLVLPYFFDLIKAPGISSTAILGLTFLITWKYRSRIDLRKVAVPTAIYTIFAVTSVMLSKKLDLELLTLIFGVFLVILALWFIFFSNRIKLSGGIVSAVICSVISGLCGGLFGIGGPLMALYYSAVTNDREEYLGNLQFLFLVSGLIMNLTRVLNGNYTIDLLPYTLTGLVGIGIGKVFGLKIGDHIPADRMRTIVYWAVLVSGVITVLKQLL